MSSVLGGVSFFNWMVEVEVDKSFMLLAKGSLESRDNDVVFEGALEYSILWKVT